MHVCYTLPQFNPYVWSWDDSCGILIAGNCGKKNKIKSQHVAEPARDLGSQSGVVTPIKDPRSLSNWYNFFDDEEKLSEGIDMWSSSPEMPSSPKEVSYFGPISIVELGHLIANIEMITNQEDRWTWTKPWSKKSLIFQRVFLSWKPKEILWRSHIQTPNKRSYWPDNLLPVFKSKSSQKAEFE